MAWRLRLCVEINLRQDTFVGSPLEACAIPTGDTVPSGRFMALHVGHATGRGQLERCDRRLYVDRNDNPKSAIEKFTSISCVMPIDTPAVVVAASSGYA